MHSQSVFGSSGMPLSRLGVQVLTHYVSCDRFKKQLATRLPEQRKQSIATRERHKGVGDLVQVACSLLLPVVPADIEDPILADFSRSIVRVGMRLFMSSTTSNMLASISPFCPNFTDWRDPNDLLIQLRRSASRDRVPRLQIREFRPRSLSANGSCYCDDGHDAMFSALRKQN